MRSFFACFVFMYLYGLRFPAASTLSGGRRDIGSAVSVEELSAPGRIFLSP